MGGTETKILDINRLLDAAAFPHRIGQLQLLETHISWVILTGKIAYKIKKPVNFGFVNYESLERRHHFCELELELNRRFAPELYLGVVPILLQDNQLRIGNQPAKVESPDIVVVDYAVKMREFPQDAIVSERLRGPELEAEVIQRFGRYVADFHQRIESATPVMKCVQPEQIRLDAFDNFTLTQEYFAGDCRLARLKSLFEWTANQLDKLETRFRVRLESGKVRRCHGDMHLKNIIQLNDRLMAFDGIEFNEQLQWIDVLSEIAFPVMDFAARKRSDLAWRLLNAYLEETGDYQGFDVLRFYLVYRAMVRAKVTCLNPKNTESEIRQNYTTGDATTDVMAGPWDKYLDAAEWFAFGQESRLAITHGFSGSGKSTVALSLVEADGLIRIRSDVERRRQAAKFNRKDKYSNELTDWLYVYLGELAAAAIDAGFPVIVDATFLNHSKRQAFAQLAQEKKIEFEIVNCDAPFEELCQRIQSRDADPSDANIDVLRLQMESHDPLTTEELSYVTRG